MAGGGALGTGYAETGEAVTREDWDTLQPGARVVVHLPIHVLHGAKAIYVPDYRTDKIKMPSPSHKRFRLTGCIPDGWSLDFFDLWASDHDLLRHDPAYSIAVAPQTVAPPESFYAARIEDHRRAMRAEDAARESTGSGLRWL